MKKVKFIDLFAGLGGLRLGFEEAFKAKGIETECVLTSEIKPSAIKALNKNFEHKKLVGDICEIDANSLEDFDFLLAGFPCQPFSAAGNRLGFADTRGTMFFEVERILKAKKPYGFLLENVEGLITHDLENFKESREVLKDILETNLKTEDTEFTKCVFKKFTPEELYGKSIKDKRGGSDNIHSWDLELKGKITTEQKQLLSKLLRERRKKKWAEEIGIKWMDGMPLTVNQIKTFYDIPNLEEMLNDLEKKGYIKKEYPKQEVTFVTDDGKVTKKRVQDESKEIGYNIVSGKLSFEYNKILDPNDIAPTLVAMDVDKLGIIDNGGIRSLSLREGLRLFGYPETYTLEDFDNPKDKKNGFDLLGNTVVINVVKEVSERIANTYMDRLKVNND